MITCTEIDTEMEAIEELEQVSDSVRPCLPIRIRRLSGLPLSSMSLLSATPVKVLDLCKSVKSSSFPSKICVLGFLCGICLTSLFLAARSIIYEEVVKFEGMPISKEPGRKGSLRIRFNIKFPARLTSEQKTGIKQLLKNFS